MIPIFLDLRTGKTAKGKTVFIYDTRKYWGPFCPLAQMNLPYIHVIYPEAWGIIRVLGGEPREMLGEELDQWTEDVITHLHPLIDTPCEGG